MGNVPQNVSQPTPGRSLTAFAVRSVISHAHRSRSTLKGIGLFTISIVGYACCFAVGVLATRHLSKTIASCGLFAFTSTLFVIGHDACHGSLTPSRFLNRFVGKISFLPSYHPFSSWEHTHNGLHHGMTNIRGHDPVFAPLSKSEYDSLSVPGRFVERFYRTSVGLGVYYFVRIWWALEMFPTSTFRPKGKKSRTFHLDRLLVIGVFFAQMALIVTFTPHTSGLRDIACSALAVVVVPFALFNAAMGFAIFLHHTHPRTRWYANERDWSFFSSQVRSVVHAEFPRIVEIFLHDIMDHTAHHVDPKIPLYNLHRSQKAIEAAYSVEIIVERWTLPGWRKTLRTCRLYDYENHRWIDYDGTPMPVESAKAEAAKGQ